MMYFKYSVSINDQMKINTYIILNLKLKKKVSISQIQDLKQLCNFNN